MFLKYFHPHFGGDLVMSEADWLEFLREAGIDLLKDYEFNLEDFIDLHMGQLIVCRRETSRQLERLGIAA
jgi:hypothetical protein